MTAAWNKLADDGARFASDEHPYSVDLDLFGPGSLYQRVNVAHTRFGQEALARFLKEPVEPSQIRLRQEAARALSARLEERQQLEALSIAVVEPPPGLSGDGRAVTKRGLPEPPDPEPLLRWAEGEPWLSKRLHLVVAVYVLPVVTLTLLAGSHFFGWSGAVWTLPFVLELVVVAAVRAEADRVFGAVSSTQGAFLRYGPMFELLERLELPSALLGNLRQGLLSGEVAPSAAMRRFERIVGWFDLRHNGLIHPFANFLLLWDAHCLLRLEAWQRRRRTSGPRMVRDARRGRGAVRLRWARFRRTGVHVAGRRRWSRVLRRRDLSGTRCSRPARASRTMSPFWSRDARS